MKNLVATCVLLCVFGGSILSLFLFFVYGGKSVSAKTEKVAVVSPGDVMKCVEATDSDAPSSLFVNIYKCENDDTVCYVQSGTGLFCEPKRESVDER